MSTLISPPEFIENDSLTQVLGKLIWLKEDILLRYQDRLLKFGDSWPTKDRQQSATNLSIYLAFRRHDIRPLQKCLQNHGLSSLGRGEAGILDAINRIISLLEKILNKDTLSLQQTSNHVECMYSELLENRNAELFGISRDHSTRIMVTLPSLTEKDYEWVKKLIVSGTRCVRINCSHDTEEEWACAVSLIKKAREETGLNCRIFMDLAGIKIRTMITKPKKNHKLFKNDTFYILGKDTLTPENMFAIECTDAEVFEDVKPGQLVWFDDGRMGCLVVDKDSHGLLLKVTHCSPKGFKMKNHKGINFPDSNLNIPALTTKDIQDLKFIKENADIVGISFVQSSEDLKAITNELEKSNSNLAVVAKIETRKAVENLPDILLTGLAYPRPFSIMIARGDLAVELGSVRLAEIQEEILWLCEAAHVPVIWATQVLETLAKKGVVSRPEITDAAMSVRAECVMLNKGKYLLEAVAVLRDILSRMKAHQHKKNSRLRALHW